MDFQIIGGNRLSGTVSVNTAKNSAVALLCASLINKGTTTFRNVPKIEEVNRIIEVLQSLKVDVNWLNDNDIEIHPPDRIHLEGINRESALKTRSAIMLIGSLVHHLNTFKIPQSGGCKLGTRTVKPHFYALENLGIKIKANEDSFEINYHKLKSADIILYESGDTVTENALMAAAAIPTKTIIKFATANYMVQDLCFFLQQLGIKIEGIGTSTLTVEGLSSINKPVECYLSEDPIEAMLFLSIAATTNSEIIIERCRIGFLELELLKLEKMGFKYKIIKKYKSINGKTDLVDIQTKASKLKALEEKIHALPFPGLNMDNLPFFVPIAAVANGQTFIHDWTYENRAIYYMELTKLGVDMTLADPHRVYINGPTNFKAAQVVCPPALRPAAIVLIAMLAAKGTSILRDVYSINRGYEDLCTRLNNIGAKIKIIN